MMMNRISKLEGELETCPKNSRLKKSLQKEIQKINRSIREINEQIKNHPLPCSDICEK